MGDAPGKGCRNPAGSLPGSIGATVLRKHNTYRIFVSPILCVTRRRAARSHMYWSNLCDSAPFLSQSRPASGCKKQSNVPDFCFTRIEKGRDYDNALVFYQMVLVLGTYGGCVAALVRAGLKAMLGPRSAARQHFAYVRKTPETE